MLSVASVFIPKSTPTTSSFLIFLIMSVNTLIETNQLSATLEIVQFLMLPTSVFSDNLTQPILGSLIYPFSIRILPSK